MDETQGVQVKLCYPLTMRAIPERLTDASCGGAIQIDYLQYIPVIITLKKDVYIYPSNLARSNVM